MKIDFTTTSLCRPEISEISLKSLSENISLNLKDCRIFLNIDPVPNNVKSDDVERLFKLYLGEVVVNKPKSPNFTKAIKWCWSQANTDFIFHYEDDWFFKKKIDIDKMLSMFNENIQQVNIRAYSYKYTKMVLSPSLIAKKCYKAFSNNLIENINPEIQLRNIDIFNFTKTMISTYSKEVIIKDIGRDWLLENKLNKPSIKGNFVKY
jgi:hypothetical protein